MHTVYKRAEVSFNLKEEIGQEGRNSKAFIAHDKHLDAELVIKVIPKNKTADSENFFNESRLLYRAAHAHVVQIQYACACEENIYLALPYYRKGSLKSYAATNSLTIREIIRYGIQISAGLHNIHSKGLIHFDVKPDNILLSDRNEALVSDFGLAKLINEDFEAAPDGMYNKHMAPEWFTSQTFSRRYDIYQFGLTLYRLICGEDEFRRQLTELGSMENLQLAICSGRFPARLTLEHISPRLSKVIVKCLEVDPNDRYQSALDVSNALSMIDDNLIDWRYKVVDGLRTWQKVTDSHEYLLEVHADGAAVGQKKTSSGQWTRIKDACGALNAAKIKKFLGGY